MNPAPDELIETLPKLLRELAEQFGFDVAMKLAKWRGGQSIYVPTLISSQHVIARKLGLAAAQWLVAEHAASNIRVDRAEATLRYLRDIEICNLSAEGKSLNALAAQFDTTQRNILRILEKGSVDPTPDLFEQEAI